MAKLIGDCVCLAIQFSFFVLCPVEYDLQL